MAAAAGGSDLDKVAMGYISFRRDWLESHGINPTRCALLQVQGSSMEPTLPEGCTLLVDLLDQELTVDRIYVLRLNGQLVVKRYGRDRMGRDLLVSDNPDFRARLFPPNAVLIGQVRWMGKVLGGVDEWVSPEIGVSLKSDFYLIPLLAGT